MKVKTVPVKINLNSWKAQSPDPMLNSSLTTQTSEGALQISKYRIPSASPLGVRVTKMIID